MLSQRRLLSSAALIAALAAPVAAFAQQAAPPVAGSPAPHRHQHGSPFMRALRTLDLSPAQRRQISDASAQMRAANQPAEQTLRANREKLRAQIEAILSPEQRARFQAELQKHRRPTQRPA
jgi:Spy/CpxP family protein refolding chaperone